MCERWFAVLGFVLLCACGGDEPQRSVAAGSGGQAGVSGTSGKESQAGASGRVPGSSSGVPCTSSRTGPFAGALIDDSGKRVGASFSARVNVLETGDCTSGCPSDVPRDAQRIVLEDPTQSAEDGGPGGLRWSLLALFDGLPSNLIRPGDTYDLTLTAGIHGIGPTQEPSQTVVLARDGELFWPPTRARLSGFPSSRLSG